MDCAQIVALIKAGDPQGAEALWTRMSRTTRYFAYRHIATQDADDFVSDVYMAVLGYLRKNDLRHPESLGSFIRTICVRERARWIESKITQRQQDIAYDVDMHNALPDTRSLNPEQLAIKAQEDQFTASTLVKLRKIDQQILVRFYLLDQSKEEISKDFGLTKTQFRLIKSRAKSKFGKIGTREMRMAALRIAA